MHQSTASNDWGRASAKQRKLKTLQVPCEGKSGTPVRPQQYWCEASDELYQVQIPGNLILWDLVGTPVSCWRCYIRARTLMDRTGWIALLKKLYSLLQVKDPTPLELSQHHQSQQRLPKKVVLHFEGDWPLPLSSGGDTNRLARGLVMWRSGSVHVSSKSCEVLPCTAHLKAIIS